MYGCMLGELIIQTDRLFVTKWYNHGWIYFFYEGDEEYGWCGQIGSDYEPQKGTDYRHLFAIRTILHYYWWNWTLGVYNYLWRKNLYTYALTWRKLATKNDRFISPLV